MKDIHEIKESIENLGYNSKKLGSIYKSSAFSVLDKYIFDAEIIKYIGEVFLLKQGIIGSTLTDVLLVATDRRIFTITKKIGISEFVSEVGYKDIVSMTGGKYNIVLNSRDGKKPIAITVRDTSDTNIVKNLIFENTNI